METKQMGLVADHSHSSSTEFENDWSYMSTPPFAFMTCTGAIPF